MDNKFEQLIEYIINDEEEYSLINPKNYSKWRSLISTDIVLETHRKKTILLIIW